MERKSDTQTQEKTGKIRRKKENNYTSGNSETRDKLCCRWCMSRRTSDCISPTLISESSSDLHLTHTPRSDDARMKSHEKANDRLWTGMNHYDERRQ